MASAPIDQSRTISFLSSPAAFGGAGEVEVVETHGAYVFLCGDVALKLKRAVTYDYMDLSTVERRRTMLEREYALNAPTAPVIYRDVVPVTSEPDGLTLDGDGPAVDWVLRMWRFPAENAFDAIAERGAFDDALGTATGEAVASYHAAAPVVSCSGGALMEDVLDGLARVFGGFHRAAGLDRVDEWLTSARRELERRRALLDARGREGKVRCGHGDLHLRNLVLIENRPVPFDALEFDDTLRTCDVLYDIAFLIMDLCRRGLRRPACRVLDAWLRAARGREDAGLVALPLFISVRAAIRAMVLLQTDAARGRTGASTADIAALFDLAWTVLHSRPAPLLIAIGGYSASGKSVLARALAPELGPLPGAVLLASDLERKAGMDLGRALGPEDYAPGRRMAVYDAMFERARTILAAGHTVVLDATFVDPAMRAAAERIAAQDRVPFRGIWLDASRDVLERRIAARAGDASDADLGVLRQQLEAPLGPLDWLRLDAARDSEAILTAARNALSRLSSRPLRASIR